MSMKGEVDCKKPRLMVHTSESTNHHINGTINLSYQVNNSCFGIFKLTDLIFI